MLEHATSGRIIVNPYRPATWRLIVSGPRQLTTPEFHHVIGGITVHMINTHDKVTIPGFKAGTVWTGLPWQILYDKPAGQDERLAAFMLGLMAQYAFVHHPDHWYTDQTTYAGRDFPNTYYFQKGALGR